MYRCQFDAYGNLVEEDIATHWQTGERLINFRNPLRFQGQYEDEESGLFYNLNRYYQPELGRYITPDPLKLLSDENFYRYVRNNPIIGIDPLGLDIITIYRSTDNINELKIYEESGIVLSDAGRKAYMEAIYEGESIPNALQAAKRASETAHSHQIKEWGSLEQYIQAHGEFGTELTEIGQRSLISFTTDANKIGDWGKYIIELKVKKADIHPQTLPTSNEAEVLLKHGNF